MREKIETKIVTGETCIISLPDTKTNPMYSLDADKNAEIWKAKKEQRRALEIEYPKAGVYYVLSDQRKGKYKELEISKHPNKAKPETNILLHKKTVEDSYSFGDIFSSFSGKIPDNKSEE